MFLFPENLLLMNKWTEPHCFTKSNKPESQVPTLLKQAPSQMSNDEIFWNFDTGMQKDVICFLSDFAWNFFQ